MMSEIYKEAMDAQQKGYNCAETVMLMAGKYYLPDINFPYSNLVTGFGGGMGRSRKEACGALTGSIAALNMLIGRPDATHDVEPIHLLISEFRDVFLKEFHNSVCESLREGYEGEEAKKMCHDLAARTVELLFDYLDSMGQERKLSSSS
jgi:C_GCAxxG_C_C family probable redox protein